MERLFYKRKYAVMTIALTIVLVLLLCILLATLVQFATLRAVENHLRELIKAAETDERAKQELLEYRKSNEYIHEWAKKMNWLKSDETLWKSPED